jgi:hypothetical protein
LVKVTVLRARHNLKWVFIGCLNTKTTGRVPLEKLADIKKHCSLKHKTLC